MATFGKTNFNTDVYAKSRPSYPQALYDFIFEFHKQHPDAKFNRAIDLGCGTGQATIGLKPFRYVTGVDLSENMLRSAREMVEKQSEAKENGDGPLRHAIDFVQSSAETLDFVMDGSVDLIISAQACHWFDWSIMWPELARVMCEGATAAVWIYSEFRLPRYPKVTSLIVDYQDGWDPRNSLGPYWQQPGRGVLVDHLVGIPEPNDVVPGARFGPLERVYFTGAYYPKLPLPRPIILHKVMSWEDLLGYLRTWSALHTFKEQNPMDAEHPEGPIELRFWKALREEVARSGVDGVVEEISDNVMVEVEWPVAMVLARKAT